MNSRDKEFTCGMMEKSMRGNGKITRWTGGVKWLGQMEGVMMEISSMITKKAMEYINGTKWRCMKGTGRTINNMGKDGIQINKELKRRAFGRMERE